jgi:hypothetical protein
MNNMELKMPRGRLFGEFVLVVRGVSPMTWRLTGKIINTE